MKRMKHVKRAWISLVVAGATVLAVSPLSEATAAPAPFSLSPKNVRFGKVISNTQALKDVTVTNNDGDFIYGFSVTGDSAFAIQSTDCPSTLFPGGTSCTVTIRFVPPGRGRYSGTFEVRSGVGVLLASARLSGSTPNN